MVVPSSTVKSGRIERAELFVTARLSCATVASWPVVLTESMDMAERARSRERGQDRGAARQPAS